MSRSLQVRDQTIPADKIITLLANYQLLPQLLRQIVIDQAIATVTCPVEHQQQAIQRFYQKYQLTSDAERQDLRALYGMTAAELDALAMREQKIEQFKHATWGPKLASYFLQRKAQLDQVIYSVIQTPDFELANELYFRLHNGEQSFADLARSYSHGPEAHIGGCVGPIELGRLEPDLRQRLTISYPGQLWMPMRIGAQVAIVRLDQQIPAQLDSAMRHRLLNELFEQWLHTQLHQLLESGAIGLN